MASKLLQITPPGETTPLPPASLKQRLIAAAVAIVCLTILTLAGFLKPDPQGLGTHTQLNINACGFYERSGYPCPTCGMTTAFALTVRARIYEALLAQPAGTLAALATMFTAAVAGYIACAARQVNWLSRINWTITLIIAATCCGVAWAWLCLLTWLPTR